MVTVAPFEIAVCSLLEGPPPLGKIVGRIAVLESMGVMGCMRRVSERIACRVRQVLRAE